MALRTLDVHFLIIALRQDVENHGLIVFHAFNHFFFVDFHGTSFRDVDEGEKTLRKPEGSDRIGLPQL